MMVKNQEVMNHQVTFDNNGSNSDDDIQPIDIINAGWLNDKNKVLLKQMKDKILIASQEESLPKERFLQGMIIPLYLKNNREYLQKEGFVRTPYFDKIMAQGLYDDNLALYDPEIMERYDLELNLDKIRGSDASKDLVYLIFNNNGFLNQGNFYLHPNRKCIITRDDKISFLNEIGDKRSWPDVTYVLNIMSAGVLYVYGLVTYEFLLEYFQRRLSKEGFILHERPLKIDRNNIRLKITMVKGNIIKLEVLSDTPNR